MCRKEKEITFTVVVFAAYFTNLWPLAVGNAVFLAYLYIVFD